MPDYPPEVKVEEGSFTDSKKIGVWKTYFANGNVKDEITYVSNRPNGYAKMYYANGKVQEEGLWANSRWVGAYKTYYENGNTSYEFNYDNSGKREGEQIYRWPNGEIMMKGVMKAGKEDGLWIEKDENGNLLAEKVYNGGTLDAEKTKLYPHTPPVVKKEEPKGPPKTVNTETEAQNPAVEKYNPFTGDGYAKLFYKGGRLSKEGVFKKFQLMDGKEYIYNSDGLLQRIAVYKEGGYIGDATIEQKDK